MMAIHQSNDKLIPYVVKDEADTLIQLEDVEVVFIVSSLQGDVKIKKRTGDGITVVDSPNGKVEIDITSADSDLPVGNYRYELVIIDIDLHRYTADQGWFIVYKSYERGGSE